MLDELNIINKKLLDIKVMQKAENVYQSVAGEYKLKIETWRTAGKNVNKVEHSKVTRQCKNMT